MEYGTLTMTRCVPEEEEDSKCPMTLHKSKVRPRCLDQLEAVGATYRMIQSNPYRTKMLSTVCVSLLSDPKHYVQDQDACLHSF